MTTRLPPVALALALALAASSRPAPAQDFSPEELTRRQVERRAVEAVLWGMPAVNFERMLQAFVKVGGGPNQVAYWSRPVDWKNQTLTPNPDTIYLMPFYDTKDGPVVLVIPPADGGSITGSVDDAWQNALDDVGPAGADEGRGGRYLILPPGYEKQIPEGYIPLQSATFRGFALLRANLASGSDEDIAKAVAYGKRIEFHPLAEAGAEGVAQTRFVDAHGAAFDATIPYDASYFESLDRFVQAEPWLTRDKAMIDLLGSIGIRRGHPFEPDAQTRERLDAAAREARALIEAQYEKVFVPPFNEGSHWALPARPDVLEGMQTGFAKPDSYPTDGRAVTYSMAYFSAKQLGAGQFYLMTIKDAAGRRLDGAKRYRLTVPANPPVKLYWSATAYDGRTHALIPNVPWASRASTTPGLQKNPDGSVDVHFGPTAPAGRESNWVPTDANGLFEILFRFYGPEKPLFDKTWKLPDLEEVK